MYQNDDRHDNIRLLISSAQRTCVEARLGSRSIPNTIFRPNTLPYARINKPPGVGLIPLGPMEPSAAFEKIHQDEQCHCQDFPEMR